MLTAEIDADVEKKDGDGTISSEDISTIRLFIEDTRQGRIEWEVDCFVNEMMKKGRHYVNDKGRLDARDPHQLRRTVNKFRVMLRRMKNAITFNDPVVDVLPETGMEDEATPEELEMASWLCLREYKQNDVASLVKQAVETAALKTWALLSVTPNDGKDAMERLTICQTYDSVDVFFDDPDMKKSQLLVISSLESRNYLRAQGYKLEGVGDAIESSHSHSKNKLDEISGKQKFRDKVLIDQVFKVEYDEPADENQPFDPETKRIVTYVLAGEKAITEKKVLKSYKCLDEIFHVFYLEEDLFDPYNPPWMSDVVPLQRSLNEASENVDTILHATAKVRVMQRKGETNAVDLLQNKHMQVLEYEGTRPEHMEMGNPPAALFDTMAMRDKQIEDQVGQHGASMGAKEGTNSGRHAALIQAGDQDNMKEPADNLQKALSWMFTQVLDIGAHNIDKVMRVYAPDGDGEERKAIGAEYMYESEEAAPAGAVEQGFAAGQEEEKKAKKRRVKSEYQDATAIRAFKNVRVTVVPGSFFTLAQGKADYMEMLPIMQKMGLEVEAKAMWKVMMRMMNVGMSRTLARMTDKEQQKIDMENADWKIAELEFLKMSNGEDVTATPEQDHEVHLRVKVPGAQAIAQRYGQDNDAYYAVLKNIMQHKQMMDMKAGQAPDASNAITEAEMEVQPAAPTMPQEQPVQPVAQAAPAEPLPLPVAQ